MSTTFTISAECEKILEILDPFRPNAQRIMDIDSILSNIEKRQWKPESEAPQEIIVALIVQDRVGISPALPKKVITAFKKPNGKWYECTTSGIYLLHQLPILFQFLPKSL